MEKKERGGECARGQLWRVGMRGTDKREKRGSGWSERGKRERKKNIK